MVGTNKIQLNIATMNEAIQYYFGALLRYKISVSYTSWKTDKIVVCADSDVLGGGIELHLNADFLILCVTNYLKDHVMKTENFSVVSVEFSGNFSDYYEVTVKEIGDDEDTV